MADLCQKRSSNWFTINRYNVILRMKSPFILTSAGPFIEYEMNGPQQYIYLTTISKLHM